MELSDLSQERIFDALRSLYRYREMKRSQAPDILISSEAAILKRRFALLEAGEIFALISFWPEYLKKQSIIEINDEEEFDAHLLTLN